MSSNENENNPSLVVGNPTSDFIDENNELVDLSSVANDDNYTVARDYKVLVVDDDAVCLNVVTNFLNYWHYPVISKNNPVEALKLLEKNEEKIKLLLTDVRMEEVDGFKLLEAGKKQDIPVIMMSANGSVDNVKKGVTNGVRNYMNKPIRLIDMQHIWQYVDQYNLEKGNRTNNKGIIMNNVDAESQRDNKTNKGGIIINDNKMMNKGKGKGVVNKGSRVRWNDELHRDFVSVVESLGGEDKAVPKKILEVLSGKHDNLTREQVASHLQKYRKNLSKKSNNKGASVVDPSFMVGGPNPVFSSNQFTMVNRRHPLPQLQNNYSHQSNNHHQLLINHHHHVVGQPQQQPPPLQPQPLQIRQSRQMIMQQLPRMMQFGGSNLMGSSNNLPQVNYHLHQQNFGDFQQQNLNLMHFIDSDRIMPMQDDEEFDASLIVNNPNPNPTSTSFLNGGNNNHSSFMNTWSSNDFSKSS